MPTQAEEFQTLAEGLYYWSYYNPECKCEVGFHSDSGSEWAGYH